MSVTLQVLYDYAATSPDECTLVQGEMITGYREQEGWWQGNSQGKDGVFPGNYVKVVSETPPAAAAVAPAPPSTSRAGTSGGSNKVHMRATKAELSNPLATPASKSHISENKQSKKPLMPGGKKKDVPFKYLLVAHNMGYFASFMNASLGLCAIAWANSPYRDEVLSSTGVGLYTLFLAFPMYFMESIYGLARTPDSWEIRQRYPIRSLLYLGMALPMMASIPTMLSGIYMVALSLMHFLSWRQGEARSPPKQRKARSVKKKEKDDSQEYMSFCQKIDTWVHNVREAGKIPKYTWVVVYLLLNAILGFDALDRWYVISKNSNGKLSEWTPWAKTFGQLLNFNCSLILCPVARNLLKRLNNYSISSLSSLDKYIPLQKNIVGHKLIAVIILISAWIHTMAHFFNFANSKDAVLDAFGLLPWFTGAIITVAMFFIYSAAVDKVRMADYSLFFNCHQGGFIVFFVMLLFHGPKFKYWCCIPITLYVTERIMRVKRGNHAVYVKEIKWIPPVLAVYFCPCIKEEFKFKEGQYLYLCCPTISKNEWHPFTISSCYDDLVQNDFVSCHIKVHPGGWTEKLKDLFEAMNPQNLYPFVLTHMDEKGQQQLGKSKGPTGLDLLKVDAPHSAPSEHYDKYETVMVVGAGIGLTPCASILRAVTQYKWKRGFYPELLHLYWVVRQSDLPSFQWFVRYLTEVERDLAQDKANGLQHLQNTYVEINVYVTRASDDFLTPEIREKFDEPTTPRSRNMKSSSLFDAQELMELLCHPPVKSTMQVQTMKTDPNSPNRLQDVWAWDGRPQWDQVSSYDES